MCNEIEMLDVEKFAAKLQVSRATIFEWIKKGILKPGRHFFRVRRVLRFPWSAAAVNCLMQDFGANSLKSFDQDSYLPFPPRLRLRCGKKNGPINWDYGK
jgi:predicted DNA-binding transcriptional regulator AlpA